MAQISSDLKREPWVTEIPSCWSLELSIVENRHCAQTAWAVYWEGLNDNQELFRAQAREYVQNLQSTLLVEPEASVLDFGCGFGFVAEMLASRVEKVFLWDTSANMRRRARLNASGHPNIRYIDLSDPKAIPRSLRFDVILVNSVVQYMSADDFSAWLVQWPSMLSPGGRIVVSDLIPPDYRSVSDIVDLLRFSASRGFLARAIWQAFTELLRYLRVRRRCPLYRIGREELIQRAKTAGLTVSCLPRNLTHFTKRVTAIFTTESKLGLEARPGTRF
jgi:SAM-dependent methyltransferase